MPTPEQIRRYASGPAAFIADLTIPGARGPVRFGDAMADFQRERFASIIPALVAVAAGEKPPIGRHWWEATKGASKDSDLACCLLWLLAFARKPLLCQIGAADSDQADELRKAAIAILRLNPWLAQRIDVQTSRILSDATNSVAEIIAADTAGSHGARPDVLIVNELSHVTKQEFAENLLDNAAKVPHGLVVIATNAGFKGTWQEQWRDIARTSDRWHFHVWDKPAPWLDPEEIEEAERRNSRSRYLRLWWGVWSTNAGNGIEADDLAAAAKQLENLFNSPELPYIVTTAGVDIGWRKDSSAIVVTGANMRSGRVRVLETMAWTPAPGSPVVIGDVEAALLAMNDVYHFAAVNADPREFVSSIQALQLRGVPIVEYPATAKNDTAMAESAWRMFRERAVDIDVSELRLLADLQRMTIVEKSGNNLKAEFPRTAAGHCDVGQAFILSLPAADEVLATYVPVVAQRAPQIPAIYRDSGMEALQAGRGLPPNIVDPVSRLPKGQVMSITKTLAEHQSGSRRKYRNFVLAVAQGHEPTAEEILSIIAPCGKSADDLQADVQRLNTRIAAAAQKADADSINTVLKSLEAERLKLVATVNAVSAECARKMQEAEAPLNDVVGRMRQLRLDETNLRVNACRTLMATASRTIDLRLKEISEQVAVVEGQIALLETPIDRQTDGLQERIKAFDAKAATFKRMGRPNDPDLDEYRPRVEEARRRLAQFEEDKKTIAQHREHIAELQQLAQEVERDRLDPGRIEFFREETPEEVAEEVTT